MAYDVTDMQAGVRVLLRGLGLQRLPDDQLDQLARHALAVLHAYRQNVLIGTITGANKHNFRIDTLTGWTPGLSEIIWLSEQLDLDSADAESPSYFDPSSWSVFGPNASNQYWLTLDHDLTSGQIIEVAYRGAWTIDGLNGETVTTLTNPILQSAFEHLVARHVCLSFEVESTSIIASGIPADYIDYQNKRMELNAAAESLFKQFQMILGLLPEVVVPDGGFANTQLPDPEYSQPYYTHRQVRAG